MLNTLLVVQNSFLEIDVVRNVVSTPLPQVTIKSLALLGSSVSRQPADELAKLVGRSVVVGTYQIPVSRYGR